jgi:thymidylate kinase
VNKDRPTVIISFMGVDGTGKTSLIKLLNKKLKKKYKKIKYIHLRPYLFLFDKTVTNKNPHKKIIMKSKFESLVIILLWLIIYKFFFLIKIKKKNQLIIFDRYAHDLLIDKTRYSFNLSNKLTEKILSFFPKPNLWIILKAQIKTIEKRKKELSTKELNRQMREYLSFSKKEINTIVLNTNNSIKKTILVILKKIESIHSKKK